MKVHNAVVDVIADSFSVDASIITSDSMLDGDLKADEMKFVEMVVNLEEEFDIKISECDLGAFKTVGDIVEYVGRIEESKSG